MTKAVAEYELPPLSQHFETGCICKLVRSMPIFQGIAQLEAPPKERGTTNLFTMVLHKGDIFGTNGLDVEPKMSLCTQRLLNQYYLCTQGVYTDIFLRYQ